MRGASPSRISTLDRYGLKWAPKNVKAIERIHPREMYRLQIERSGRAPLYPARMRFSDDASKFALFILRPCTIRFSRIGLAISLIKTGVYSYEAHRRSVGNMRGRDCIKQGMGGMA